MSDSQRPQQESLEVLKGIVIPTVVLTSLD